MAWFFSRKRDKELNQELARINSSLALSFSHVREDTSRLFQWLQFLSSRSELYEKQLGSQQSQIQALRQRLEALEARQKPRHSFRERIIQKITKSSKDYVSNLVLSYIRKY